jgi:hypothetical protein
MSFSLTPEQEQQLAALASGATVRSVKPVSKRSFTGLFQQLTPEEQIQMNVARAEAAAASAAKKSKLNANVQARLNRQAKEAQQQAQQQAQQNKREKQLENRKLPPKHVNRGVTQSNGTIVRGIALPPLQRKTRRRKTRSRK